jgi:hypothetical protein
MMMSPLQRRWTYLVRASVLALLVVAPALADAPLDQYDSFDKDDVLIRDKKTILVWQRDIRFTPAPYSGADGFCALWNGAGGRIPTIKELLTIFDEAPHKEYNGQDVLVYTDPLAFGANRTPIDNTYWSSTPVLDSLGKPTGKVWTLNFGTGQMVDRAKTEQAYYRCVKG